MAPITIYTRQLCGFCTAAINLLTEKGFEFEEIAADNNPTMRAELIQRSGQYTLPQIFVGQHSIGGFQELAQAVSSGEFEALLKE